jgi:hypothetical protein
LILAIFAALTPALAQDAARSVFGTVGEVNAAAAKPSANLVLLTKVGNADAPGKIPDEMALRIADLEDRLKTIHARWGNPPREPEAARQAAHMKVTIDELKRWREMPTTIGKEIPLESVTRQPMSKLTVGTRLRIMARAERPAGNGRLPDRMVLMRDALQVPEETPMVLRPGDSGRTYEFVGTVATLNPLVLQDGALKVTVVAPAQLGFIQRKPATIAELLPGQKLRAVVRMKGEAEVQTVERMLVFVNVSVNEVPDDMGYGDPAGSRAGREDPRRPGTSANGGRPA